MKVYNFMKKEYFLLISLLILTSCNINNADSFNSVSVNDISSSNLSITEENINYEATSNFSTIFDIYISVNETYNLNQMLYGSYNISMFKIKASNDNIQIDDKGNIKGLNEGDTILSLIKKNKKQDINIHVTNFNEYGSYFISVDKGRLYKKNVLFFGDSITHNWLKYTHEMELIAGYDGISQYGYLKYLNNICHFSTIINLACSGGTMATLDTLERPINKSFDYLVYNNKENIQNADYIFVWYGTNDYGEQVKITNSSFEVATSYNSISSFDGSMRYGINKIKEYNPNVQIIFLNILYRKAVAIGSTYSILDYNKAIDNICKQYMCKYIDMYSLLDENNYSKYLNEDGLHPNDEGYKLIADYILNNGEK